MNCSFSTFKPDSDFCVLVLPVHDDSIRTNLPKTITKKSPIYFASAFWSGEIELSRDF